MQATTTRVYPWKSIYMYHFMHEVYASLRPAVVPLPAVPVLGPSYLPRFEPFGRLREVQHCVEYLCVG